MYHLHCKLKSFKVFFPNLLENFVSDIDFFAVFLINMSYKLYYILVSVYEDCSGRRYECGKTGGGGLTGRIQLEVWSRSIGNVIFTLTNH